ncbi:MAG: methyltransferase [Bacteroidota bacterium]|nr:methyltransferase [Bacteroidota bacterium]
MDEEQDLIKTPAEIMQMASAFQKSRIFLSAYELGVFTALGTGEKTSEEVSEKLATELNATARLMNALVAIGLLRKEKGKYSNQSIASKYLVRDSPDYLSGLMHLVNLWDTWSHLTESVRKGSASVKEEINEREEVWLKSFIQAMHARGINRAKQVAPLLDFSKVKKILDVGGGSGIFTFTFLKQNDKMNAVIFDLPNVVPITREHIYKEDMTERVKTIAGDYLKDDIGSGYDMIFLSAVVHSNSYDDNQDLIRKCADSLNPGGQIVILDYVMNDERTEPIGGTIFAINMLVGTQKGDTYTQTEISDWLLSAGMSSIEIKDVAEGNCLVIAKK